MNENIVISGKKNGYLKKLLIHFFISAMIGWFIAFLSEIIDSVIAANAINEDALAAVVVVLPVYTLIIFVSNLLALGTGIKYSHEVGKGDFDKANKLFTQSFFVSIVLGLILAIIMFLTKEPFLRAFCSDNVLAYAKRYFEPYILVAAFYPVFCLVYQTVCVDGDFKLILICDVVQPLTNLTLSLLLIKVFMKGDIFSLGLATMISMALEILIIIIHFFKKNNTIKFNPYFDIKELGSTVMLCMPTWLNILFVAVLDLIMNYVIYFRFKDLSANYLNVYAIINFTINFVQIMTAAGASGSLIWAIAKGEKNNLDMHNTTSIIRALNYLTAGLVAVIFASLCMIWPKLYGINEQPYLNLSIISCLVLSLTNIFTGLMYNYCYYYVSQDKIMPSLLSGFFNMLFFPIVIGVPLSYTGLKFYGYIIGFGLAPILTWYILLFYIRKKYGIKNFPFYLPDVKEHQYCFNLIVDQQSIMELKNQVETVLNTHAVEKKLANRILLTIEESYMMIKEKNLDIQKERIENGKEPRVLLSELFIGFTKDEIRLIEKDDGVIFKLANKDQTITDLRTHVFLQALTISKSVQNAIAVSTNTNTFVFNRINNQ